MEQETFIAQTLRKLEEEQGMKILFAIEAGSRAWRMESADSDYDVRFVYVYPPERYLELTAPPDVLHRAYDREGNEQEPKGCYYDLAGFDIYKFLKLLEDSNPSIIEWLRSDILYHGAKPQALITYIDEFFRPIALYHHYLSMAEYNYKKYIQSDLNKSFKKYLYAMRGIVNALWVERYETIPPISFPETLEKQEFLPLVVKERLLQVIAVKKGLKERDGASLQLFEEFIEKTIRTPNNNVGKGKTEGRQAPLNEYLRELHGI